MFNYINPRVLKLKVNEETLDAYHSITIENTQIFFNKIENRLHPDEKVT